MNTAQTITQLSHRLESSLGKSAFPSLHKRLGTQLLEKLRQSVQVTVVGLPQSGKSSIINMLLGWSALPALPKASIVEVVYGPQARALIEYKDGTHREISDLENFQSSPDTALRITLELPEEILLVQSFAEVTLTGSDAEIDGLLHYVVSESDLVIWSSAGFGPAEQALWRTVPDHIKDHSFLALTKADQHQMKGHLTQLIDTLSETVAEEFYGLYPIATLQALQACGTGKPENANLWTLSGGEALCDVIDQQISLGRAEDLDRVHALLNAVKLDGPDRANAQPDDTPTQTEPPQDGPALTPKGAAALEKTMADLQSNAEALSTALSPDGSGLADIITHCIETVRSMTDSLVDVANEDATIEELLSDAQQGEDMLMLLQLEEGEDAAADAVSLLVQLKKEVSARVHG